MREKWFICGRKRLKVGDEWARGGPPVGYEWLGWMAETVRNVQKNGAAVRKVAQDVTKCRFGRRAAT